MSSSLQLLRIEHKLDLLLGALQHYGIAISDLPQLEDIDSDICPVCRWPINFTIDVMSETYDRGCGCRPPIPLVPGISGVMTPPQTPTKDKDHGSGPEQADPPREG